MVKNFLFPKSPRSGFRLFLYIERIYELGYNLILKAKEWLILYFFEKVGILLFISFFIFICTFLFEEVEISENAHGLSSDYPGHKTTAYDLEVITRETLNCPLFKKL